MTAAQGAAQPLRQSQVEQRAQALSRFIKVLHSERKRHSLPGTEEVDGDRHIETHRVLEQQRLIAFGGRFGHPIRDLGDFQVARDRLGDADKEPAILKHL